MENLSCRKIGWKIKRIIDKILFSSLTFLKVVNESFGIKLNFSERISFMCHLKRAKIGWLKNEIYGFEATHTLSIFISWSIWSDSKLRFVNMVFAFCFFLVERKLKKIYGSSLKEVHRVKMRQSASIHSTHFKCRNVHCIYMSSNLIIYGLNCTYECRFRFFFFFSLESSPENL